MDPATLAALAGGAGKLAQGLSGGPSSAYQAGSGNLETGSRYFVFGSAADPANGASFDQGTLLIAAGAALGLAWIIWGR